MRLRIGTRGPTCTTRWPVPCCVRLPASFRCRLPFWPSSGACKRVSPVRTVRRWHTRHSLRRADSQPADKKEKQWTGSNTMIGRVTKRLEELTSLQVSQLGQALGSEHPVLRAVQQRTGVGRGWIGNEMDPHQPLPSISEKSH